MRTIIVTALALSLPFIPGCYSRVIGGPSVEVSVSAGYSTCEDDDDMDREELIYIDNSHAGFWLALPGGGWVFRCRTMWYDTEWEVWRYGPWYNDHSISYTCHCHGHYKHCCPFHGVRFHVYMSSYYPKYHHKHFYRYYHPHLYHHNHHYNHGGQWGHGQGKNNNEHWENGHGHGNKGHGNNGHGNGYWNEQNSGHPGSGSHFEKHFSSYVPPEPRRVDPPVRPQSSIERARIIQTNETHQTGAGNGKVFKIERDFGGGGNGQIHKVQGSSERTRSSRGSNNPIRVNDRRSQLGQR